MEHPENSSEYAGLQVNSGVDQQPLVNPYLQRGRFRRRELTAAEMVEGIVKGDVRRRRSSTNVCPIVVTASVWALVEYQVLVNPPLLTSLASTC